MVGSEEKLEERQVIFKPVFCDDRSDPLTVVCRESGGRWHVMYGKGEGGVLTHLGNQ